MFQLGVYGACYKLSIIISLMIQAFRYAAEPFFFSQRKRQEVKRALCEKGDDLFCLGTGWHVLVCYALH